MPTKSRPTLAEARAKYVHRFTMERVPDWALEPAPNGKHYAPQYHTDREWYDNTLFPGDPDLIGDDGKHCMSTKPTWPLGQWLTRPYTR